MQHIQRFQSEEALKILGDPTRLSILRMLIAKPATISQLGKRLRKHPAQIRNHLQQLQKAAMVELLYVQNVKNYTEKYYRATARAFFVNLAILPMPLDSDYFVTLGSDDLALDALARQIENYTDIPNLYVLPVGSLEGLIYLRENYCHLSGSHLFDPESGEYNISFVRHLFPDQTMMVVTLAHRQQGFLVQPGNPKKIHDLNDLTRQDIHFINRKRGSGTRISFDNMLQKSSISPEQIDGYNQEVDTHMEIAGSILSRKADTGLAIFAAARQSGLDFIPILKERYDLVIPKPIFDTPEMQRIVEHINSSEFRQSIKDLGGYDTQNSGHVTTV